MIYTNRYNLPAPIFEAIVNDSYDFKPDANRISVTSLIDSPKIRQLKMKHHNEIEEDVSESLWRLMGQAVHSVLERANADNRLMEERLKEVVEGMMISGKFDIYDAADRKIADYKITSAWSVVYNPTGKPEWVRQANVYAWLLRRAGFPVDKLEIHAILRDWSKTNAMKGGNYPPIPFVVIRLELWTDEKTEAYIRERVAIHAAANNADPDALECSPDERWTEPTKYAVYSKTKAGTRKARADRVFESMEEAEKYAGPDQEIETRPGSDRRCAEYCPVAEFCSQYQAKKAEQVQFDNEPVNY